MRPEVLTCLQQTTLADSPSDACSNNIEACRFNIFIGWTFWWSSMYAHQHMRHLCILCQKPIFICTDQRYCNMHVHCFWMWISTTRSSMIVRPMQQITRKVTTTLQLCLRRHVNQLSIPIGIEQGGERGHAQHAHHHLHVFW